MNIKIFRIFIKIYIRLELKNLDKNNFIACYKICTYCKCYFIIIFIRTLYGTYKIKTKTELK